MKETAEAVAESTDLEKGVQDTEFLGLQRMKSSNLHQVDYAMEQLEKAQAGRIASREQITQLKKELQELKIERNKLVDERGEKELMKKELNTALKELTDRKDLLQEYDEWMQQIPRDEV